jgi:hypothetical protein
MFTSSLLAWCLKMSRVQRTVGVVAILISFLDITFLLLHGSLFGMPPPRVLICLIQIEGGDGGFCGTVHSDIRTPNLSIPNFMKIILFRFMHGVGVQNTNSYRGARKCLQIF